MTLALPDCRAVETFFLTPTERRELLLLIAQKGEAGVDEFIERHRRDDSRIAQKIARIRARLEEEAAALRRRLSSEYGARREEERERTRRMVEAWEREEAALRKRSASLGTGLPLEVERRLKELPIIELAIGTPRDMPWYRSLAAWVRRLWTRFKRWLRRILGRRVSEPKAKGIVLGWGRGPGVAIDVDLETALATNPQFRKQVRRGLGATPWVRARRMARILLGLDDYAEVAQKIMEQEATRAADEQRRAIEGEQSTLTAESNRLHREEEEAERKLAEELTRLEEAERKDQEALAGVLEKQPLKDTSRIVVEELETGGFLRRLEEGFEVTGRFLETLASIVYAEEAHGAAPTAEAPVGSSIEGEGILDRGPMLSFYESSHMDVVGSLAQARQRHPHVRHLLEEDVLVYRERRTSVTHAVVILDRSLSMADNDRMVAAKRAALALHWATKMRGAGNRTDFILMGTGVERANLSDCWNVEPKGFTNVGRALDVARNILTQSRANRKLLFLVTDGLPEALTVDGKDVAGRPEEALRYALASAERLRPLKGLSFRVILLESRDPSFTAAAKRIADKAMGTLLTIEPKELARSLLVDLREPIAILA